jgi:hypothetical protein
MIRTVDIYTTCITLGEATTHALSPSPSFDYGHRDGSQPAGTGANHQAHPSVSSSSEGNPQDANTDPSSSSHRNSSSTDSTTATTAASGAPSGGAAGAGSNAPGTRSSVDLDDAMHRLCVEAMAAHQCLVSFTPVEPETGAASSQSGQQHGGQQQGGQQAQGGQQQGAQGQQQQAPGRKFNFHLSGGYQQVMSARGSLLRDSPFKVSNPCYLCRSQSRRFRDAPRS